MLSSVWQQRGYVTSGERGAGYRATDPCGPPAANSHEIFIAQTRCSTLNKTTEILAIEMKSMSRHISYLHTYCKYCYNAFFFSNVYFPPMVSFKLKQMYCYNDGGHRDYHESYILCTRINSYPFQQLKRSSQTVC